MRRHLKRLVAALAFALAISGGSALPFLQTPPAFAVQPDEVLADPELEARARRISVGLRCLVCQNQSIDDSNADMARDLRILVRERLEAGDGDGEIIDYLVSRYGEFVLLQPRVNWGNAALWAAPVLVLLAGGAFALVGSRRRRTPAERLSPAEEEALRAVLDKNRH